MARKPRAEVEITASDKTRQGFDRAKNSLRQFSARAKRVIAGLATGFAALGAAVGAVGLKLFQIGSDALETRNKFESVFGDMSDSVNQFAEDFGKVAGLTRSQAQGILATTGAIAQGLGFTAQASAQFSQEVVQLAGDLGSFNNLPTEETARAIQSALAGERESLKRLGIVIKQTEVDQRALNITGKTSVETLTDQERATATLQLITERAGAAVGDLTRTQDSAANRARQVRAQFMQLAEDLAVSLIPVLESVLPILQKIAERFAEIVPKITEFVTTFTDAVGLTNGAVRAELDAIRRADLTIEELRQRQLMVRRELQAAVEEGELEAVQELEQVEAAIFELIRQRLQQERQLTEQAERRTEAARQEEAARAARTQEERLANLPVPQPRGLEPTLDLELMPIPIPELLPTPEQVEFTISFFDAFRAGFETSTAAILDAQWALTDFDVTLGRLAGETLVNFQDAFVEAFEAVGAGENVFASLSKAIKRSIADAATAEAKVQIATGVAKIAAGIFPPNPAAFASAAQHFAAAALFAAAAGAIGGVRKERPGGGGVGGRGAISEQSIQETRLAGGPPPATLIVQGSLLDMSDPAQADAMAKALSDLSGREITVQGGI